MSKNIIKIVRKIFIALVGTVVMLLGFIMVPYPGPGWLVVFAGLAILATEFEIAHRVLKLLHDYYDRWSDWIKKQKFGAQILVLLVTCAVIIITLWLFDAFGILNHAFNLNQNWLISPLFM